MATKLVCDYCLREITANYTRMSIQTVTVDGVTAASEVTDFEFHPRCYNALQGLIGEMQRQQQPPPLEPSSPLPVAQPVNDDDPEPLIPVDITPQPTPVPDPGPSPIDPPPEPTPPEPVPEPGPTDTT